MPVGSVAQPSAPAQTRLVNRCSATTDSPDPVHRATSTAAQATRVYRCIHVALHRGLLGEVLMGRHGF
jgi:hypothetical protein